MSRGGSAAIRRAPCPAGRTGCCAATPSPSSPSTTKFTARRFGSACTVDGQLGRLGQQLAQPVGGQGRGEPARSRRRCAPRRPTLASPPLSPLRARATVPSGTRRVGPGRRDRRLPEAGAAASSGRVRRRRDVDPGAVGQDGDVGTSACGTYAAVKTPYGRAVAGRRGEVEARVAGQRQLDGGAAERPADDVGPRSRTAQAQQRAGRLLGVGVGWSVRASVQRDARPAARRSAASNWARTSAALASMSGAGEHERDLVAEPAERVQADLQRRRRRLAAHAGDPHPVGAVVGRAGSCRTGRRRPGPA